MAQIEGVLTGARVLLVEDLISEGTSKLNFIRAIRDAGGEHDFCLFHYGIFASSTETLRQEGGTLHALATWHDVLAAATKRGGFIADDHASIKAFLDRPEAWQAAR